MSDWPPPYVSRETGAAALDISVDTFDAMVKAGTLPKPVRIGISGRTPRWRWADVDAALVAQAEQAQAIPEPFFREDHHGAAKSGGRRIA